MINICGKVPQQVAGKFGRPPKERLPKEYPPVNIEKDVETNGFQRDIALLEVAKIVSQPSQPLGLLPGIGYAMDTLFLGSEAMPCLQTLSGTVMTP